MDEIEDIVDADEEYERVRDQLGRATITISQLRRQLDVAIRGGHDIELVGEGELASCKRCHGGECQLAEPCVVRLAKQLDAKETELSAWHEMFGTTQLTHAIASIDAKDEMISKLNAKILDYEVKAVETTDE